MFSGMQLLGLALAVFNVVLFICGLVWFRHLDEGLSARRWAGLLVRTALVTLVCLVVVVGALYGLMSLLSMLPAQVSIMGAEVSTMKLYGVSMLALTVALFGGVFWRLMRRC